MPLAPPIATNAEAQHGLCTERFAEGPARPAVFQAALLGFVRRPIALHPFLSQGNGPDTGSIHEHIQCLICTIQAVDRFLN